MSDTAVVRGGVVRWGIVGCGDVVERKSGPSLGTLPRSRLVAVMRRSEERIRAFAQRFDVPHWTTDAEALIRHPEVDAVYVATPPNLHRHYALRVAEAGKPCLVEKPAGRSAAECAEMADAFGRRGLPLFVSYYRRHLPKFLAVREILDTGRIGVPVSLRYRLSRPPGPEGWRHDPGVSGGGLFWDLGGHVFDLFDDWLGPLAFLGGDAIDVLPAHRAEDAVALVFTTAAGALGSAHFNFAAPRPIEELEIEGTGGSVRLACLSPSSPVEVEWKGPGYGRPRAPRLRRWLDELRGRDKHRRWLRETLVRPAGKWVQAPMLASINQDLLGGPRSMARAEAALRTSRILDAALADYYGQRHDAFWERPASWRSRSNRRGRRVPSARALDARYALDAKQHAFFEHNGYLGPFRCESPYWRSIVLPAGDRLNLHLEDPLVLALCEDPAIVERAAQLLGGRGLSLFKTRIWSKPKGKKTTVAWHQDVGERNGGVRTDGAPVPTLTAWLAFDSATRASGAVRIVPGTHRRLLGDWRRSIRAGLEQSGALADLDLENAPFLETQPGEFWLFHSWLLHGSGFNTSSQRRAALNMRFCEPGDEVESEFEYVAIRGPIAPAWRAVAVQEAPLAEGSARARSLSGHGRSSE
ncbi:MAG: Gfo/Idh/MocA family oxidoreductase [Nitrococcus sp.]|nr:Gfo/Idh/MocA family oxidoreductase [Nitrococcus sp.]